MNTERKDNQILIIDDESSAISALRRILARNGYTRFASTTDPSSTQALIDAYRPDLVILDLSMPQMDGFAVLQQIRSGHGLDSAPTVLVVTALGDRASRIKALEAGAGDFLVKPYDPYEVLLRVRNLLDIQGKRRLFASFLDSTPAAMIGQDARGNCTYVNRTALDLLGYQSEEMLIGKEIHGLLHRGTLDGLPPPRSECPLCAAPDKPPIHREGIYSRADARPLPVEQWIYPLTDERQQGASLITFVDTSARIESERSLRLADTVFNSVNRAILVTDEQGRIISVNPAYSLLTGWSQDEVLGLTPRLHRSGQHGPDFYQSMWQALLDSGSWEGEICNLRKDGSLYIAMVNIQAVRDDKGKITNYISVIQDLTEVKRQQEELECARRRAEDANKAKSRFLATMSHEIRTPLNAIINMNNLLLESKLDPEQHNFASAAVNGGQLLLALLNNVLDFSKIEAGKLTLERQWFNAIDTVNMVASLFSAAAQTKGIEIVVVSSAGMPAEYHGDPIKINQILTNLVGNAIKFTETGGVSIRLDYHHPPKTDGQGRLLLHVQDSGIGIPEAQQRVLFDEFVQADNSSTRRYQGSGLGLTISLRMVELMGGTIRCDSREGEGARFSVEIPVSGRGEYDSGLDALPASLRQARILVYSTNAFVRDSLVEQLKLYGIFGQGLGDAADLEQELQRLDPEAQTLVVVDTPLTTEISAELDYIKTLPRRFPRLGFVRLAPMNEIGAIDASKSIGFRSLIRKPARLYSTLTYLAEALDARASATAVSGASARFDTAVRQESDASRPARILLVEDTASNVRVATAILQKAQHEVIIAWSGEEALEFARESKFDLILMDVSMPVMDGLEATQRIRMGNSPNRQTPIIAMTANTFAEDREKCFRAGMNDFIAKPIDIANLRRALSNWLAQRPDAAHTPTAADASSAAPSLLTSTPLFESSVLDQLAVNTSVELVPELIDIFLGEAIQRIDTLEHQHGGTDFSIFINEAHSLKSGAGSFGVLRLQQLAQQLEKAAKEQNRDLTTALLLELPKVAEASFAALKARKLAIQEGLSQTVRPEDA